MMVFTLVCEEDMAHITCLKNTTSRGSVANHTRDISGNHGVHWISWHAASARSNRLLQHEVRMDSG